MDWPEADERFERMSRTERGSFPTGSEQRRRSASKKTRKSDKAKRRIGKQSAGLRKRRLRRFE